MKKLKDMLKDKMIDIRKKRNLNQIENKNKEEYQSEDEQKNTIYESAEDSEEREERVKEMELEYAKDEIDEQQGELTLFKEAGDGDSGNQQKGGGIRKKTNQHTSNVVRETISYETASSSLVCTITRDNTADFSRDKKLNMLIISTIYVQEIVPVI
ncbi:MAG: hypothetical protein EZS28_035695 [Streblomastix strix]|uniref:Uncharacterized protein n=1 Tax=Streblomastix strix TaxID=222440 RepID=A0A5J4UDX5_9EUKA|nr:MAG: hypothetical protein EZS28_035695 [Streblomastix strix]